MLTLTEPNACAAKKFRAHGNVIAEIGLIFEDVVPVGFRGRRIGCSSGGGMGKMASDGKTRPGRKNANAMSDGKVVSLGRDVQVKIGQHLRTMYDEVVKQGVPDQFSELLQRLDPPDERPKHDDKPRR
jgi:hypothetical protein